ncbi:NaeI family type II restriction endonuclease [Streptomyces bauhiniae]|uniref:NaeI family type II restriction endonuclease n=1 Tax=Streptomyces bauhiniae TaxID=2340725 RepID=UPI00332C0A58
MDQEELMLELPGQRRVDDQEQSDPDLEKVRKWFLNQKDCGQRFGAVIRKSMDEVLDGQRTGRYDLYRTGKGRVEKTEKTYLGTKVEIVARDEFDLGYGESMDYSISGIEVDAKWTIGKTWTIPKEAMGHICLVMRGDDRTGRFGVGLVRITQELLNLGENGDRKRTISAAQKKQICWIVEDGSLPDNLLLSLERRNPKKLSSIFEGSAGFGGSRNGGQRRVSALFKSFPGELVDRTTVVTVARQEDGPKRVRDARKALWSDGYVILGHLKPHLRIAMDLGLPVPRKGSWVSARLALIAEDDSRPSTVIDGRRYGIWREGDACTPAPVVGNQSES